GARGEGRGRRPSVRAGASRGLAASPPGEPGRRPRAGDDGERRERRQPAPFPGGRPGDRAHHEEAAVGRLLLPVQLLERLQDQAQDEPPLSRGRGYWLRLYRVMSVRAPMTPSAARSASCWKR